MINYYEINIFVKNINKIVKFKKISDIFLI